MKKLVLTLFLTCLIALSLGFTCFAKTTSTNDTKLNIVRPQEVAECPIYGIHSAACQGDIYYVYVDGVRLNRLFSCFKCRYCGESLYCSGYPQSTGGFLGYWFQGYTKIGYLNGVGCIETRGEWVEYKSTPGLPGWRFYSN